MDVKGPVSEGSGGNEEHVTGNWNKGILIVAEDLVDLGPTVMWKSRTCEL